MIPPVWRAWFVVVGLSGWGCTTAAPAVDPLEPLPSLGAYVPDDVDLAARDVAASILAGDDAAIGGQIADLVRLDEGLVETEGRRSGVLPFALDARNATVADPRIRRMADEALLDRTDLDAGLRKRVTETVKDDPLDLARRRIRDRWILRYGRAANTLIESVGRSGLNATLLPYRLAQSVIGIALAEHVEGELSTPERQALAHWKRFVEQHPDAPEAKQLLDRIRQTQLRWIETQRERLIDLSRSALEVERPLLATVYADRALRYSPEDETATRLRDEAHRQTLAWREKRERALTSAPGALVDLGSQRALALALLDTKDPMLRRASRLARELLAEPSGSRLRSEAEYVLAVASLARGVSGEFWDRVEAIAIQEDATAAMARHARAEWEDPERNPHPAFGEAIGRARGDRARATLLGPLKDGARSRRLPRWLEWLVEVPSVIGVAAGLPSRLLQAPFQQTDLDVAAIHARRTLELWPAGPHSVEIRRWLVEYEKGRGNMVGALGLLMSTPGAAQEEIATLREFAATQAYNASLKEKRRDVRLRLLMDAAQRFQGTEGGQLAGEAAGEEIRGLTAQNIRISRGFLLENPKVAGPDGLALRPELLDGEPSNGELHPDGVTLLGERVLEIALLEGRASEPAQTKRHRVSAERLSRLVAQLEEATLHTLRTDRDAEFEHDADRDLFLERARLGVTGNPDVRPHAESNYAFLGMRERYGLVRSRESILPVQLVLQGNFEDFGLGAFPRIRMPKQTPDAFLYQER